MQLTKLLKQFLSDHPQLKGRFIVVSTNVEDHIASICEMVMHVSVFFALHKDRDILYFTADGHCFFTLEEAKHQVFWLEDKTITAVPREQVLAIAECMKALSLVPDYTYEIATTELLEAHPQLLEDGYAVGDLVTITAKMEEIITPGVDVDEIAPPASDTPPPAPVGTETQFPIVDTTGTGTETEKTRGRKK